MLEVLAHAEHHGGGGAHAKLVRGAVHVEPVFGEALQASDPLADFVVENFRAAAGNGIEPGIAQTRDGVANTQGAVFRDGDESPKRNSSAGAPSESAA